MSQTAIALGAPAPDFTALNQREESVSLAALRGQWVVLYFYPKDDTPGCTIEACDFTAGLKAFAGLEAVVLGCSPDDAASHRRFIAKHALGIDLLSDPDHELLARYGAWGEKTMYGRTSFGVLRSTVLIDPQGQVAHHWSKVKAEGHAEAVREKLAELRAAAGAKG
ncbi:MAG: peroxiredoxin [Proteobacteria bacterium]|nr:peroxiredoxin [Pseudomonadota bacterium]